jgi:hypothetical protein
MHMLFIVKPRLIVIYTLTLYREATPNRDLFTYCMLAHFQLINDYAKILMRGVMNKQLLN